MAPFVSCIAPPLFGRDTFLDCGVCEAVSAVVSEAKGVWPGDDGDDDGDGC